MVFCLNILFLTLVNIRSLDEKTNIYADLCRELAARENNVDIICPDESAVKDIVAENDGNCSLIKIATGKIQKTSFIKKGLMTLTVGYKFKNAIKKICADKRYDLIVYSTPPITLVPAIRFIKKRDGARSYLLLKDIFPQNAVDIGLMSKTGIKSILYEYFRREEKKLYRISDNIGCMSPANVTYLLSHNPYIAKEKVHINPNSIEIIPAEDDEKTRNEMREKYSIPRDTTALIYGGNLGKPQGIDFITECIDVIGNNKNCVLYICGSGTERGKLKDYLDSAGFENVVLINGLERSEYEKFVKAFDIGLIFLDRRFTIPNFPSRILSYMQAGIPVIACTDKNTDLRKAIEEGNFGKWCESKDPSDFADCLNAMLNSDLKAMGENGRKYLCENYDVKKSADLILDSFDSEE